MCQTAYLMFKRGGPRGVGVMSFLKQEEEQMKVEEIMKHCVKNNMVKCCELITLHNTTWQFCCLKFSELSGFVFSACMCFL